MSTKSVMGRLDESEESYLEAVKELSVVSKKEAHFCNDTLMCSQQVCSTRSTDSLQGPENLAGRLASSSHRHVYICMHVRRLKCKSELPRAN